MGRETGSNEPQSVPAGALTSEDVETMLNRADMILTRGGGLTSRVIRWFTDSYWNHAAIVFALSDKALIGLTMMAPTGGVTHGPWLRAMLVAPLARVVIP